MKPSIANSATINSQNKNRLHLHNLITRRNRKSVQHSSNVHMYSSKNIESYPLSKSLTAQEIEQRLMIERNILAMLEVYTHKPRLWQKVHSSHVKRRILNKSHKISNLYSLPNDLVRKSISELFVSIDENVLKLRQLIEQRSNASHESDALFQNLSKNKNQWCSIQLERAKQILPNLNVEEFTENELLQKYTMYIFETLTPKPDKADTNCASQLREQPLDLDYAYEEAERTGKDYLTNMLKIYHERSTPDIKLIKEMIDLGLKDMKTQPTKKDIETANNFLSKVSLIHKTKEAYESGLHNMGDDFMLLRFGKVFGPNALPTTARTNMQFIYLVHLFIQSILRIMFMIQTTNDNNEDISLVKFIIGDTFTKEINSSIIKFDDDLFSPKLNVDQWTWLLEKWRDALRTFPIMLTQVGAFTRLLRTTIGIGIARIFNFAETIIINNEMLSSAYMNEQLFHALQTGFYFGVAYAVVDCLQDEVRNIDKIPSHHLAVLKLKEDDKEQVLTPTEAIGKWLLIMEDMLSGKDFDRKEIPKTSLTPLLLETFDSLIILTKSLNVTCSAFNELALLLRSQRMDKKTMKNCYTDEELFLGAMLKSHFTYTCTTFMANIKSAREESERLWIMPFLGQLTDDCRDFYDDLASDSVTSFTHFAVMIRLDRSSDQHLLNPFYAFLYLCSDLYISSSRDTQTGAFLGRRISRTLKSIEISSGESALREFLHLFCRDNTSLHDYFWNNLRSYFPLISDPEKSFFRKINDASIEYARTHRKLETYIGDHLQSIENALEIRSFNERSLSTIDHDENLLVSAMNYSVKAGGKRLRPLLMMMISDLYKIDLKNILPLACGIEYLHTSSLVFDDLPAQDNSDLRRGRSTLHKTIINGDIPAVLCEGRAQLAAVDLIAISMSLINHDLVKNGFSPTSVNRVVCEISSSMHDLCIGQMMDLRAAHMGMDIGNGQLDELDRIAWLKTGKAIEIVIITPVILALPSSTISKQCIELARIRELGRLMGILFQMRDDLLDVEGENIGKPTALDVKNNTVTYVSVLGIDGTQQRLKDFRRKTLNLVDECWPVGAGTIKEVVNYFVDRKN